MDAYPRAMISKVRRPRWRASLLALLGACLAAPAVAQGAPAAEAQRAQKKAPIKGPLAMVINYPYQITGEGKTKIHATFFLPDFTPAAGAVARVNGKKVCVADKHGVCIFDYTPGSKAQHKLVATLKAGGKIYRVTKSFKSNARTESFRSDQLFVYTDRGVYNPGDTIHVRMLAWELLGTYEAIPGAEITALLQSPEGRIFGGEKLKTDADGVAALDIPLPKGMPLGHYELKILYQKAAEVARLRVERFQPPVMHIKHDLKRFLTPAQTTLPITARLSYPSGGVPEGATLRLIAQAPSGAALIERPFSADKIGHYGLTLHEADLQVIRAGLQAEQPFQLRLIAQDRFGRVSEVKRDVVYTERPYRAVLECDKDDYPAGEEVVLTARVVDLDGRPARGIKLEMQLEGEATRAEALTNEAGVAELRFPMSAQPRDAVVRSPLMTAELGRRRIRLNQPKPMISKVKDPPNKEGISTYIDVTFHKDYAPVERVVHVDLTDNSGGLVAATTLPVVQRADGVWAAGGAVKADTWGTMLANLYVVAVPKATLGQPLNHTNVGFITEGQHVTLLPGQSTQITLRDLQPTVRPGALLDVVVDVKMRSGQEAALGASMVDQAVISLMDPLEIGPFERLYNPQRKVISTAGAGVLSWPVVDRNWGTPWRDIAYNSWGYKGPGAWVTAQEAGEVEGGFGASAGFGAGGGGVGVGGVGVGTLNGHGGLGAKPKKSAKPKMVKISASKIMLKESPPEPAPMPAPEPTPVMAEAKAKADMAEADMAEGEIAEASTTAQPEPARREAVAKDAAPPKQITLRTDFPETALWAPKLRTEGGVARLRVRIPDAITVQELTLVASDRQGGVGVLRQPIAVRQDAFVRLSLPDVITLGDDVTIHALARNASEAQIEGTLSFSSQDMVLVGGPAEIPVVIPAGGAAPMSWKARPKRVGAARVAVKLTTPGLEDSEIRVGDVRPAGAPSIKLRQGVLKRGAPFEAPLTLSASAVERVATLNVSFPNLIPALQAWQAAPARPLAWVGVSGVASQAIMDAAMLAWGLEAKQSEAWVEAQRARLTRAGIELVASQRADGAWGWFYAPQAADAGRHHGHVYMTALALRALLEIKATGRVVDDAVLTHAIKWLYAQRGAAGLWAASAACFWEVNAPEADWGLSAELWALLVNAEAALMRTPSADLKALKGLIEGRLKQGAVAPATLAWGLKGLRAWGRWQKDKAATRQAKAALKRLLDAKRGAHWEPHWYHAYGGMVELNALILELLAEDRAADHAATIREVITWLLSTREAWGAWHNEVGTSTAVRALLKAGAGATAEIPSVVVVSVNGAQIKRVDIDPADPFLSAAALRRLEITEHLKAGENLIRVSYDGALTAPVTLALREWGGEAPAASALSVTRQTPEAARLGEPLEVSLTVTASRKAPYVQITDGVPANAILDVASLDALVKAGAIQGYDLGRGEVTLFLEVLEGAVTLRYLLNAASVGVARHPGLRVKARLHPDLGEATLLGAPLTVSE
ncbi:hypothetical protein KJ940_11985 [Myxococcota bacterium]|nr:hypothetical protein [Myxococcota bacterium]